MVICLQSGRVLDSGPTPSASPQKLFAEVIIPGAALIPGKTVAEMTDRKDNVLDSGPTPDDEEYFSDFEESSNDDENADAEKSVTSFASGAPTQKLVVEVNIPGAALVPGKAVAEMTDRRDNVLDSGPAPDDEEYFAEFEESSNDDGNADAEKSITSFASGAPTQKLVVEVNIPGAALVPGKPVENVEHNASEHHKPIKVCLPSLSSW